MALELWNHSNNGLIKVCYWNGQANHVISPLFIDQNNGLLVRYLVHKLDRRPFSYLITFNNLNTG